MDSWGRHRALNCSNRAANRASGRPVASPTPPIALRRAELPAARPRESPASRAACGSRPPAGRRARSLQGSAQRPAPANVRPVAPAAAARMPRPRRTPAPRDPQGATRPSAAPRPSRQAPARPTGPAGRQGAAIRVDPRRAPSPRTTCRCRIRRHRGVGVRSLASRGTILHVSSGAWMLVWMMLALKIPVAALLYICWWSVRQAPETADDDSKGGSDRHPHTPSRRPRPRPPRRGPHADPPPLPPARIRAKGKRLSPSHD
jgi:hypothetical protein